MGTRAASFEGPSGRSASPTVFIPLASSRGRWIIAATALGSGMVFLDSTVVNVALPKIQTDLGMQLSGLQWIVDAYALFLSALLLVGGAIGDLYGRRRAFVTGICVFALASLCCGLSPTGSALIASRAIQGVGGALLVPGSLAMIKSTIEPRDSARAIGLWAGLSGATTALGPLLGGYLIGSVSWRLIFFINLPLAAITIFAAVRHVPETRDRAMSPHIDWLGSVLTVVGLGGVTFGLIQGPDWGWTSFPVLVTLVAGSVCLVAFPFVESVTRQPVVPLALFRSLNFTGSNLATVGVYFSFSGAFLFLVLKFQQIQGYTPLEAGAALLPVTVCLLLFSSRVGGLVPRFGARALMSLGALTVAIGFTFLGTTGEHASYWTRLLPAIVVLATGMTLFVTPLTATVMSSVPESSIGVASGVNNATSRVAGLFAIAGLGVVMSTVFGGTLKGRLAVLAIPQRARTLLESHSSRLSDDHIPSYLHPAQRKAIHDAIVSSYLSGFRWTMMVCAVFCFAGAVVSWLTIRPSSPPNVEAADI